MNDREAAAGGSNPISASRRLLVMMPSWAGDCVMATPMLRAIRRLSASGDHDPFIAGYMRPHLLPLFETGGIFDECIGGRLRGLLGPNREAKRLRRFRFDAALLLPNSFRAAWTIWLARTPRRIGYDRDKRGWLLSHRVPAPAPEGWDEPVPLVKYYLNLAERFGADASDDARPRLDVASAETARAVKLLDANGLDSGRPIALINPGATKEGKRWPADRFAAVADHLHDTHSMQIVVNGAPDERELTRAITARVRRVKVLDLAQHETTLGTLAAICGVADLVVTNDTGTRHIAAAVGFERMHRGEAAPGIVTIFGTVPPEWTTLDYPYETELFDRHSGRVEAITLDQVVEACRRCAGKDF